MIELAIHSILVWAVLAISIPTFLYLLYKTAPFGRHYPAAGWGPSISNRTGWIIMELPTVVVFLYVYLCGESAWEVVPLVFLVMWQAHYVHRTLIFPFRLRTQGKRMPIAVAASGVFFNVINAYINARVVSEFATYDISWLSDPRFLVGLAIFLFGMGPQPPFRHGPAAPAQTRRDRLRHSPGRRIPFRLLPEPSRGNTGMGRLGTGDLVDGRLCLLRVHCRQPGAEGLQPPPVVPGDVRRLSDRSESGDSGDFLNRSRHIQRKAGTRPRSGISCIRRRTCETLGTVLQGGPSDFRCDPSGLSMRSILSARRPIPPSRCPIFSRRPATSR